MACHVDAHHATAAAVRIMRKYGIYERRLGLVGVRLCGAFVDFVWFGVEWNVYCNLFVGLHARSDRPIRAGRAD